MTPEDTSLLVARVRTALKVALACVAIFLVGDLDVPGPVLGPLYTLKLAHALVLVGLLVSLDRAGTRVPVRALALATVGVVYAGIAVSDWLAGHLDTTPLLGVVLAMSTATLFPWGVAAQVVTTVWLAVGTAVMLACTGKPLAELADPATSVLGALLVSVYVAYESQRYRRARTAAERALAARARIEALRADVQASASEASPLEHHLQVSAEAVVRHLDAAFARIWTLSDDGATLELRASAGMYVHLDGAHARVPVGELKIGRIAAERRPHLTNAVVDDPWIGDRDWARQNGLIAFAGHPLLAGERLLGVVAMFSRTALEPVVLEGLASVAHAIGLSILRSRDAEALSSSQARVAEEAAIATALARVAEDMFASLETPVVLERLCQLTVEELGSTTSTTLLWQPEVAAFVPAAFHGVAPEEEVQQRASRISRETMAALFGSREGVDVVEYRSARSGDLHVCMALRRGKDVVGIQTGRWRGAAVALTPPRRRVARGLARMASMALANARLVEELERANRLKSEFVSTMSHELRTPLNVILGYAEMALDSSLGVERETCVARIETAARELLELIQGTLEVGRLEAGREDMELERIEAAEFWSLLGESCGRLPRNGDVTLDWIAESLDGKLVTDPRKLTIVVRNLVGNACKFTEHGRVWATAARDGGALVVRVGDTGIGIRPEDQGVIFEMFRQADGSDSRRYGGTGLGLYIVRRFVQGLGGTVTLESAPGRGSVFTVTLPWREEMPAVFDAA